MFGPGAGADARRARTSSETARTSEATARTSASMRPAHQAAEKVATRRVAPIAPPTHRTTPMSVRTSDRKAAKSSRSPRTSPRSCPTSAAIVSRPALRTATSDLSAEASPASTSNRSARDSVVGPGMVERVPRDGDSMARRRDGPRRHFIPSPPRPPVPEHARQGPTRAERPMTSPGCFLAPTVARAT